MSRNLPDFEEARAALTRWQKPSELVAVTQQLVTPATRPLVRGRAGDDLEEAWMMARFVQLLPNVEEVRLSGEQWPDGYIKIGGKKRSVEITEVMERDRRPASEPELTRFDTPADAKSRIETILEQLD